jgi:hypothetical protein
MNKIPKNHGTNINMIRENFTIKNFQNSGTQIASIIKAYLSLIKIPYNLFMAAIIEIMLNPEKS